MSQPAAPTSLPERNLFSGASAKTALLILLLFIYAFFGQGWRGLWKPDEGRYTCVALNMLDTGDWIYPQLNDERPHFTKPPLTYWSIAASVLVFGRHEWAARIPSALAFVGTVLLIAAMGRRLCPRKPRLAALIYASFPLVYVAANLVTTDTLLTFWEALAMFGFVEWWHRRGERNRIRWAILMWIAFGFAFLTKGPPGLLPLIAIVAFTGRRGGRRELASVFAWSGILLFLLVGTCWYVAVCVSKPELVGYFFGSEFYGRIVTGEQHRNSEWYGAFVIYIPVLLAGALPWNLILMKKIYTYLKLRLARSNSPALSTEDAALLLALWFLLPLAVFFIARSRLPLYLVPLFVPLSLIIARQFEGIELARGYRRYLVVAWLAILAASRIASAGFGAEKNTFALADAIRRQVPWMPKEIVFVESLPDYGLKFYLDTEVEAVSIKQEPDLETLAQELSAHESGQVFIVNKKYEHKLLRSAPPAGCKWVKLGGANEKTIFYAYQRA
ncbi:glycosyltransferase family 39 protein [bacterium]|nr:glycosyltransferase family 39 protein [bacterium]